MIPAHAALLAAALPDDGPAFPSLRHLRLVGAMPPPALVDALRRKCSPNIYIPYSITEVGVLTMATPDMVEQDPLSAGPVQPWATVEVVDSDGFALPAGQIGELRMQVEGMPRHYHGEVYSPAGRFRDGWFYPGDRGRFDARGHLYVEGRVDDLLNVGGNKVQPEQIENVIAQFTGVRESVAFMRILANGESQLAAAVIRHGELDLRALHAYCVQRLELLAPVHFVAVTAFPRNASGKVIRRELAAQFSETSPAG
jgi:acyl-coenzyme A synthetase/AMP-(fatty) acid ligase